MTINTWSKTADDHLIFGLLIQPVSCQLSQAKLFKTGIMSERFFGLNAQLVNECMILRFQHVYDLTALFKLIDCENGF